MRFNYLGEKGKRTTAGGLITIIVYLCYLLYLNSKFVKVGSERGDVVSIYEVPIDQEKLKDIGYVSLNKSELEISYIIANKGKIIDYDREMKRYIEIVQVNTETTRNNDH